MQYVSGSFGFGILSEVKRNALGAFMILCCFKYFGLECNEIFDKENADHFGFGMAFYYFLCCPLFQSISMIRMMPTRKVE